MSIAPIERLLLLCKLPDAQKTGKGWSARCPAHEDRRPSLSIAEGEDGRVLIRCFAGCKPEAIVAALGLRLADLMPVDVDRTSKSPRKTGVVSTSALPSGRSYATATSG